MRLLIPLIMLLSLSACPQPREAGTDKSAAEAGNPLFQPSMPIPAEGALLHYDGLTLGMSTLELSQIYNAPDGQGEGFFRGFQDYESVQTHVIEFEREDELGPRRTLTLSFYRDQLYVVVDRIEGISAVQTDEWFARLEQLYGAGPAETVASAQWTWGDKDSILMAFTRDNSSELSMTANIVLEHKPTGEAAYAYLQEWEKRNPNFLEDRQKAASGDSGTPGR
jgi:hypothetical protein